MDNAPHIALRALEPEDLELIYRVENDADIWRYGSTTVPYSRYAVRQYLEQNQNDIFMDRQLRMVAVDSSTGKPVGLADLTSFDPKHQRAEIGLLVLPECQRRGIGQSILSLLEAHALQWPLHQLYAIIAVSNEAAQHLFRNAGYTSSGLLHDWLLVDRAWTDAMLWQKTLL